MKFSSTVLALLATALPAVWSLPTVPSYNVPTCAAEQCLQGSPALFDGCAPGQLGCLCGLNQTGVTRYMSTVQPCIDDPERGGKACTAGARYQYKDLLTTVCKDDFNKTITWPATQQ